MTEKKDWKLWHGLYNDGNSSQAQRLALVQQAIFDSLPDTSLSKYQIVDICAGDGRDLLNVLAEHTHRDSVHSYLVELDHNLATEAIKTSDEHGLNNVTVVIDDASLPRVYRDVVPADLILLCGVFGNISKEDVEHIIRTLPQFSKKETTVIWTQNLRKPELVTTTRELFHAFNFDEISFKTTDDSSYGVGVHSYAGKTKELNIDNKLFTFIK